MYLGVGANAIVDEATTELLVTATELGTKVLATGDGIWMPTGIPIQTFLLTDNYIHTSNPKFILMGTIPGSLMTPSKGMGTMRTLEITIANANVVNVVSAVNVTGSADAAIGTRNRIQTVYLLHNPILTLLNLTPSHTLPKKSPSSKMTSTHVIH